MNQSYSFYYDTLEMKVSFCMNDYQIIVEEIKNYTEKDHVREMDIEHEEQMFSTKMFCIFLDEEKEDVVLAYHAYVQGRWGAKTRHICILITKDKENEGQYFLHVYY